MSIRNRNQNKYKKDDWNAICQICGFKYKFSELKQRWDGYWVCKEDWEPRHPQELRKAIPDDNNVPFSRKGSLLANPNIRVVSYNIKGADNTTGGNTLSELTANITPLNADVVLLQELDDETQLSNLFAETNYDGYVYGDTTGQHNLGILYNGSVLSSTMYQYTAMQYQGALAVNIQNQQGFVYWAICTHLSTGGHNNPATGPNELIRVAEVEELKVITDSLDGFVIWGGDCNFFSTTGEEGYELATSYWTNCLMEAPPNFVPSNNVGRDWIFIKHNSTGIQMKTTQSSIVDNLTASDHQPVWADILLPFTYG